MLHIDIGDTLCVGTSTGDALAERSDDVLIVIGIVVMADADATAAIIVDTAVDMADGFVVVLLTFTPSHKVFLVANISDIAAGAIVGGVVSGEVDAAVVPLTIGIFLTNLRSRCPNGSFECIDDVRVRTMTRLLKSLCTFARTSFSVLTFGKLDDE